MTSELISSVENTELFIVEGPTAANALKPLRDRCTQAILPMQGKIPNAARLPQSRLKKHAQLNDLVRCLLVDADQDLDRDSVITNSVHRFRYERVVLLNDPDVDGIHAGILLVIFFYHCFPELIQQGRLYVVRAPLFGLYRNGEFIARADSVRQLDVLRSQLEQDGAVQVRRFKGIASVDKPLLLDSLSPNSLQRQLLTQSLCQKLCKPFL